MRERFEEWEQQGKPDADSKRKHRKKGGKGGRGGSRGGPTVIDPCLIDPKYCEEHKRNGPPGHIPGLTDLPSGGGGGKDNNTCQFV